ncbi:MAG: DUF1924 domain-containing protein [Rhodoplanes sp.]
MTRNLLGSAATLLVLPTLAVAAAIGPAQIAVLDRYVAAAKAEPGYAGPSNERGRVFFFASHAGGKPDTPACTSCQRVNLTGPGQTRAGKPIDPMAPSVVPTRYTDAATVEKWFKRNCSDVLGRECTAAEKADALVFLLGL